MENKIVKKKIEKKQKQMEEKNKRREDEYFKLWDEISLKQSEYELSKLRDKAKNYKPFDPVDPDAINKSIRFKEVRMHAVIDNCTFDVVMGEISLFLLLHTHNELVTKHFNPNNSYLLPHL